MAMFRWGRAARPVEEIHAPEDSPTQLLEKLDELDRYVNRRAGRLPLEAVVTARRITDDLREVLTAAESRALDIYAVVSVKGILTDYLPTSLSSFLALDPGQLDVPRAGGATPVESLQEQLDSLSESAWAVLVATRDQDADALMTQGRFLRTKFSRSDLDL
ncbi:hypothetical protein [Micromonospora chalcea]|uniref:hypothetical protein n=1 Tax=Micromonospora chalcea TaxID=1874 RepID=UPI0038F65C12